MPAGDASVLGQKYDSTRSEAVIVPSARHQSTPWRRIDRHQCKRGLHLSAISGLASLPKINPARQIAVRPSGLGWYRLPSPVHGRIRCFGTRSMSGAERKCFVRCCKTHGLPEGSGQSGNLKKESLLIEQRRSACFSLSERGNQKPPRSGP